MLRQRLVRQSALSSTDAPPLETCSPSRPGLFRPVSTESFDRLVESSPQLVERSHGRRRHSVAVVDAEKPTFKNAFNSAFRRMSTACSYLVSSSQPALNSSSSSSSTADIKHDQVVLPPVLDTFRCRKSGPKNLTFSSNRRFSTDFPPPSYHEATSGWKLPRVARAEHDLPEASDIKEIAFKKISAEAEVSSPDSTETLSD